MKDSILTWGEMTIPFEVDQSPIAQKITYTTPKYTSAAALIHQNQNHKHMLRREKDRRDKYK